MATLKAALPAMAAAGFYLLSISGSLGAPALGAGDLVKDPNPTVQTVRTFCYNRYTGYFKHWGPCYRPVFYRPSHPRVFCYNRYTGQFRHWGSCNRWL